MGTFTRINNNKLISLFLICICFVGVVKGHVKLNVPRVRLPYFETISVNFTLKVDTPGCYSW